MKSIKIKKLKDTVFIPVFQMFFMTSASQKTIYMKNDFCETEISFIQH